MAKHKRNTSAAGDSGTMRSPEGSASPHVWTAEEMQQAQPLPLAAVGPSESVRPQATPHAGNGQTSPGGRPESNFGGDDR